MAQKKIIMDVMNDTAEIKVTTEGYIGMKCVEESEFLKAAVGQLMEQTLLPIAFEKSKEGVENRVYKPICG